MKINRLFFHTLLIMCVMFSLSFSVFAKGKQKKTDVRLGEVIVAKSVQGRIDSIRNDKIVITYEPQDQQGVTLQTYYLRDDSTKFNRRKEGEYKAGDIVTVSFQESTWTDENGKKHLERIVKSVDFVRTREAEETRTRNRSQSVKNTKWDEGPQ